MTFSLAAFEAAAQGYVTSPPAGSVWKSGSGGCVRTGYWTPTLADADCDPDLVPRARAAPPPPPRAEVAPPPPPKPEVAPVAPPPPPKPAALKPVPLTLGAAELFAFDRRSEER